MMPEIYQGNMAASQMAYWPQTINTSGSTVINLGGYNITPVAVEAEPPKPPLEWLRAEIAEVCELARAV